MQSYSKPTTEQIESVAPRLRSPEHAAYFFARLDNPEWIMPLKALGFFENPPTAVPVEGGGIRYPNWPEGKYLVRVAHLAPDEVASIMANIQTDNWSVAHDVVDAAKQLPAEYSAKLVEHIAEYVENKVLWHDLNEVSEVSLHLLRGGQQRAAMVLFRRSFKMAWNEEARHNQLDDHWYISCLDKDIIPAFVPDLSCELIEHLFSELRAACQARNPKGRQSDDDFSYVWRPAIESHEQNRDYEVDGQLVGCARKAIELAVTTEALTIQDVLNLLDKETWLIFKRLRLHVLRIYGDQVEDQVKTAIMDHTSLYSPKCQHEYGLLVHEHFGKLSQRDRDTWLTWAKETPELGDTETGRDEQESQQAKDWRQYRRLVWVREHLTGENAELVERVSKQDKKPELAYFPWYMHVGRSDPRSGNPYTVGDLRAKGFAQAVEVVSKWRLPRDADPIDGPSIGGVRGVFQEYCGTDPVAFSAQAEILIGKPGEYVRAFLTAMNTAYKDHKDLDIRSILSLCAWVLTRDIEENTLPDTTSHDLVDSTWRWTWDTIAELTQNLCGSGVSLDHKDQLWRVIEKLADAPVDRKAEDRFEGEDPRNIDFINYSLNATSGKGMRSVMEYAHWMGKSLAKDDRVPGGFGAIPEVRNLLERKLDTADPGGVAVRGVYGWRFGLLYWIDRDWLRENTSKIFPLQGIEEGIRDVLGWAAWNSFLIANRPHKEFYDILRDQYSYAVDQLKYMKESKDYREGKPIYRLAEHLMVLFWRCDLDLGTDNGIVERALTQPLVSVRSDAIRFVGRSLHQTEDDIPADMLERLQSLWEWYWANVGQKDASDNPDSSVFGWWFASGKFSPEWSLSQMTEFAKIVPRPEPDHMIAEQLVTHAEAYPKECIEILTSMINGDNEGWHVYSIQSSAREILTHGMRAGGEAKQLAEKAIDTLGRRGYVEFGELLQM